jgi:hypothetical protein
MRLDNWLALSFLKRKRFLSQAKPQFERLTASSFAGGRRSAGARTPASELAVKKARASSVFFFVALRSC